MTDTAITTATQNKLPEEKTLMQIEVEIKFHLGQMAGHAVEIGKLLIEAKSKVEHGDWLNWLEENFNLKKSSATNFMKIAERFGANFQSTGNLNQTQLVEMLALPEGEVEKFMAEKTAEGTPVEDMTAKKLREEIKEYKARLTELEQEREGYRVSLDNADAQLANLGAENEKLKNSQIEEAQRLGKLADENLELKETRNELESKIEELQGELESVSATTVEVEPEDYEPTKKELEAARLANEQLQEELKNLQEKPVEVAVEYPADYEANKKELEALKEVNAKLQKEMQTQEAEMRKKYYVVQQLKQIFTASQILLNEIELSQAVAEMSEADEQISLKIMQAEKLAGKIREYFNMWKASKGLEVD